MFHHMENVTMVWMWSDVQVLNVIYCRGEIQNTLLCRRLGSYLAILEGE